MSLSRVRDVVKVAEGGEKLTLRVDSNPVRMVSQLAEAHALFEDVRENGPALNDAAWQLASAIFGDEQAQTLMDYYHDDGRAVARLCCEYFNGRLKALLQQADAV